MAHRETHSVKANAMSFIKNGSSCLLTIRVTAFQQLYDRPSLIMTRPVRQHQLVFIVTEFDFYIPLSFSSSHQTSTSAQTETVSVNISV